MNLLPALGASTGREPVKAIYRKNLARSAALALTFALVTAATLRAAEIKVVTSGAFTAAYLELVPEYERATHNQLVTEFGPLWELRITLFRCAWNAVRRSMS